MRATRLSAIALVLGVCAATCAPAQAGARGPSVTAALSSLKSSGAITEAAYRQYTGAYAAANSSLKRLGGTRRAELAAVIADTQGMAAAGQFTATRLPVIFLTLERNRQWWTTQPLISSRVRVSFPHSLLVWEYYAGQGIQIQWLGTFGKANGYYLSGHENTSLRQLLSEALGLATKRAGGIAWEYMFHFDGGSPPWTSGLSQGTALQVMARAWSRLKEPAYLTAAQQALGVFQTRPSNGVQVKTPAGAEYAEYTYAPSDRILNGFIQADVGLYDYSSITHDPLGLKLFEEGDAEARAEVPRYDTGAWSMYDQYGESDLSYHELLTEFLAHLCERTRKGPPTSTTVTPAPSPTPPAPGGAGETGGAGASRASGGSGASPETGGASAAVARAPERLVASAAASAAVARAPERLVASAAVSAAVARAPERLVASAAVSAAVARAPERLVASAAASAPTTPIAGDQIYCATAQRFTTDLHTPPVVSLITSKLPSSSRAGVQVSLSKISTVKISVKRSGRIVWSNGATVQRGKPRILWATPSQTGAYQVTITATDLAGNFSTASGTITLTKH